LYVIFNSLFSEQLPNQSHLWSPCRCTLQ